MTEFLSDDYKSQPGREVYDMNMAVLDSLEEMEKLDKKYKRRERLWYNGGPILAIAPLLAAGALMVTHAGRNMENQYKADADAGALLGSSILGLAALNGYCKSREAGQRLAEDALPVSFAVSRSTQPWIERRLAERDEDIRKKAERIG